MSLLDNPALLLIVLALLFAVVGVAFSSRYPILVGVAVILLCVALLIGARAG